MDLLNPNTKYELLADNVPLVFCATGGLLQKSPIVCGGNDDDYGNDECNFSQDCAVIGKPEMKFRMIEDRISAASKNCVFEKQEICSAVISHVCRSL